MHDQMDMSVSSAGAGPHRGTEMRPESTGPQLAAVTLLTLLALAGGVLLAALFGNLTMRAGSTEGMGGVAHGGSAMAGMGGHDMRRSTPAARPRQPGTLAATSR
jgi:hypothetical protein